MNPLFVIFAVVHLAILVFVLYQLASIAVSTRETHDNTSRMVVLLTVIANKQGATQSDIEKAVAK